MVVREFIFSVVNPPICEIVSDWRSGESVKSLTLDGAHMAHRGLGDGVDVGRFPGRDIPFRAEGR